MSTPSWGMGVSSPARVFSRLQADDALLPGEASALRKSGAMFLALMVLAVVPLFLAANASGLIGDTPSALASSGPGHAGTDDLDDDGDGDGAGGDDDDSASTGSAVKTDDTSANGHSTRGTTDDNDTRTKMGTDDTSANGASTNGTTNDNDTRTKGGETRTGH